MGNRKKHPLFYAKPGDLMAVDIGSGKYGFIGVIKGASLGVYRHINTDPEVAVKIIDPLSFSDFFTYVAPIDDPTRMITVGHARDLADAWAPPRFISPDAIDNTYKIVEEGDYRRATKEESEGLHPFVRVTPAALREWILENLYSLFGDSSY